MKVALFVTCLVDQCFPEVGLCTVRLLERLGCRVDFPEAQACCGQPAFNGGHAEESREAARVLLDAFEDAEYVVSPSGSCVGMLRGHYPGLFAGDPELRARAERLATKTYELSEFLVDVLGVRDVGARAEGRLTFHPSCHATRLLGVRDQPLELLGAVAGAELVPLHDAEACCGFGGAFAVKQSDVSAAITDEKAENVEKTGATLVGTDMGCLMNIAGRLQRRGSTLRVVHLAELLAPRSSEDP